MTFYETFKTDGFVKSTIFTTKGSRARKRKGQRHKVKMQVIYETLRITDRRNQ